VPGHEQHRVGAHRAGREGDRARHVAGRRVHHEAGRARRRRRRPCRSCPSRAASPRPRTPSRSRCRRPPARGRRDRVELPEHARPAAAGQVVEVVQGDVDRATAHRPRLRARRGARAAGRPASRRDPEQQAEGQPADDAAGGRSRTRTAPAVRGSTRRVRERRGGTRAKPATSGPRG
jgi:hypothetical protein